MQVCLVDPKLLYLDRNPKIIRTIVILTAWEYEDRRQGN